MIDNLSFHFIKNKNIQVYSI